MPSFDIGIQASTDDGFVASDGSGCDLTGNDILMIAHSTPSQRFIAGFRFDLAAALLELPVGAIIDTCRIDGWCYGTTNDGPWGAWFGVLEPNPATFNTTTRRPYDGDLALTTASVEWKVSNLAIPAAQIVSSPDLSTILQEIADQRVAADAAVAFIFQPETSPDNLDLRWHSVDHATSPEPRLYVTYHLPASIERTVANVGMNVQTTAERTVGAALNVSIAHERDIPAAMNVQATSERTTPAAMNLSATPTRTLSAAMNVGTAGLEVSVPTGMNVNQRSVGSAPRAGRAVVR